MSGNTTTTASNLVSAFSTEKNIMAVLNKGLEGTEPAKIVVGSVLGVAAVYTAAKLLEKGAIIERLDAARWRVIRTIAQVYIQGQIDDAKKGIVFKQDSSEKIMALPEKGWTHEKVLEMCVQRKGDLDHNYGAGGCSGTVYHGGAKHTELINKSMEIFQWSNPLHVDVFGAVRKMEAEIVEMTLKMFNGQVKKGDACGSVTSGGTESIGMAMKSYREQARMERGLTSFSIVCPITIHPAFDKAAHYYGMDIIKVPVDPVTQAADPALMEKYIRHDTVVLACSAPSFPNGTIDNVPAVAKIALKHGIMCHVDCCLGSFIVPFLEAAGYTDHHRFDFRVPGVTSISCDTHKYGAAPKGTSVIMYSSKDIRKYQFFACAEWPGGNYASPAAAGSKAGNVIAGTWAAMVSHGYDGYLNQCKQIVGTNRKLQKGLNAIPSLSIIGTPNSSVLGFTSNEIDVFELSKKIQERGGWMLNPLQFPSGLQFSLTLLQANEETSDRFLVDVRACVEELRSELKPGERKDSAAGASLYGSQQRIADRTIIKDVLAGFCDKYYVV